MEFVANTIDVHTEPREDRSRRNLSHAFTQVNSICQRLFNNLPTREYTSCQQQYSDIYTTHSQHGTVLHLSFANFDKEISTY